MTHYISVSNFIKILKVADIRCPLCGGNITIILGGIEPKAVCQSCDKEFIGQFEMDDVLHGNYEANIYDEEDCFVYDEGIGYTGHKVEYLPEED